MIDYIKGILDFALNAYKTHTDSDSKVSVRVTEEIVTDGAKKTTEIHAENLTIDEFMELRKDLSFDFRSQNFEIEAVPELDALEISANYQIENFEDNQLSTELYFDDVVDMIEFNDDTPDDLA